MAVLGQIRKRSIFLIIVIGMALFAFVISGVFTSNGGFGSNKPIGEINGEEINYETFNMMVEQAQNAYGLNTLNAVNLAWDQGIKNQALLQELDKLGIDAGKDQLEQIISSDQSIVLNPLFQNEIGLFDFNKFSSYISQLKSSNPTLYNQWRFQELNIISLAKQKIYQIAKLLNDAKQFRGVMSHAGESYNVTNETSLLKCAKNEVDQTLIAVSFLKSNSIDCELITIGSTPTMFSNYYDQRINELRAGVFVFFDLVQAGVGTCKIQDIALSVLTSVISINEESNSIIVDAGWTALSRDTGNANHTIDYGYGQVCNILGEVIEDLIVSNLQQEHGIIRIRENSKAKLPVLKPGDLLRILPNHACATAAAHNKYHVINKKKKIDKIWNRFNYW